jgi:ATP-dependent 26S proteasome regulatory subunit
LQVEVGLPDEPARNAILTAQLRDARHEQDDLQSAIATTARRADGGTGADLHAISQQARLLALRESGFDRDAQLWGRHLHAACDAVLGSASIASNEERTRSRGDL